uniref:SCAN box domain-containing protein n=1 Tax=Gouania willdenowi TaxID=441366 RepID=A0A8C5E3V5_GOUWI
IYNPINGERINKPGLVSLVGHLTSHRKQFRSKTIPPGENPTETYHHLKGLYRRWVRPEQHSKEEIGKTIILEQLLRMLPVEVRTWEWKERPDLSPGMAMLVRDVNLEDEEDIGLLSLEPPVSPGSSNFSTG